MGLTVHQGQWAYGGVGALGPIWGGALGRPKADIMEAEGRLNGGVGTKPPGILVVFLNA